MMVTIATATVPCCYQVPGHRNVVDRELTVQKDTQQISTTLQTLNAVCSFYAAASWAVTFSSPLLEQIHPSRPWTCNYQA